MKTRIFVSLVGTIVATSLWSNADILVSEGVVTNFSANFYTNSEIIVGEYDNGASIVVNGGSTLFGVHDDRGGGYQFDLTIGADRDTNDALTGQAQNNDTVTVTGPGSEVITQNILISGGPSNSLTVADSGGIIGTNYLATLAGLCVDLSGGTNAILVTGQNSYINGASQPVNVFMAGTSDTFKVLDGAVFTNGTIDCSGTNCSIVVAGIGTIMDADSIIVGASNTFTLSDGAQLETKGMEDDSASPFVIGDGMTLTAYQMDGGIHAFLHGLVISSNSVLCGCGVISGAVTNYGLILVTNGCDITFEGPVNNYGSILALNGEAEFQSRMVNFGTVFQSTSAVMGVSLNTSNVVVHFDSVSNYLFDIQAASALEPEGWVTLTNGLPGTGQTVTFTDLSAATNAQRFYRILMRRN